MKPGGDPAGSHRRRSRGRRRLLAAGTLVLLYTVCALGIMQGRIVDRMLLFPRTFDAVVEAAERRMVGTAEGEVEVWIARPPASRPPALYLLSFHGNGDSADNMLNLERQFWADQAVEIWCVNYPGYGRSDGPAHLDRLAPAGVAAFDALRRQAGDAPIVVSGNSLGSTMALHVAAHRRVEGVILRDPPPLRQLLRGEYGWWNLWLLATPASWAVPSALDSLANAARVQAPGVFIFNADDGVVPLAYQQLVQEAYGGPAQSLTLPGNHNEIRAGGAAQIVEKVRWLVEQVTGTAAD